MIARVVMAILCAAASAEAGQAVEKMPDGLVLAPHHLTMRVPLVDGHDLQFKRVLVPGLSQTRVAQIVQDDKGFMWFGTQDGLHRYDGHTLKVFRHDSQRSNSLSGVYIYSLLRDRANTLWVGSDDGIDRFNPVTETFERLTVDGAAASPTNVSGISQDSAGTIWLSTRSGLYQLDSGSRHASILRHDPRDASTLSSSSIQFVSEDAHGELWVGTSAGLDRLDRVTHMVVNHMPLPESDRGLVFRQDRQGVFWIIHGADGRLSVFDRNANVLSEWMPTSTTDGGSPVSFNTMLEDRDGTMWFGTLNHGILKFDRDHKRFIRYTTHASDPNSLSDRRVNVLYQDQEGLIWAGLHQAAPNYFLPHPPAFQRLQSATRQSSLVSFALRDRSGLVWLGLDRGIMTLDRTGWTYAEHQLFRRDETTSMVESAPGVFWIGTAGQGLKRYERHTERVTTYRHDPAVSGSLPSDFVEQVKLGPDGAVWAVTWRGLARWDPIADRFVTFMPSDAPAGLTLHTVAFGSDGVIWVGSNLGLHRVDKNRHVEWFRHDRARTESLSNDRVNAVYESRDGSVWIGTQNGLDQWDASAQPVRRYTEADGLAGNTVSCILEDDAHRLWISTNRGISRLDIASKVFTSYGTADGLSGVNMTGWGSCSLAESGEMFFAGFAGAAAFMPARVVERVYMPPPVLTRLRFLDTSSLNESEASPPNAISYAAGVRLLPSQDKFSIEFAALSFLSPETNRFRYRMQGLQKEWTEVGSDQRVATFMALPAGDYAFQLQAAAGHGPWSDTVATLQIVMLPPWWNTWTFYACVVLAAIGSLTLAYRFRVRQLARAYNVRLEERWAERTRIARELHDTLLQSFQGLMFRLQTVRNLLPSQPDEAIAVLEPALLHGDDAIDEARNAVDGLRASEKVIQDLESGLTAIAAAMADINHARQMPSWTVVTTGYRREARRTVLYELYPVAQEALSNAFRHARSRTIAVALHYGVSELRISVTDDGVGFDDAPVSEQSRRHWGLQGMRERVERLGGRLSIQSRPGQGTVVSLAVPADLAYRKWSWTGTIARRLSWLLQPRSMTRE